MDQMVKERTNRDNKEEPKIKNRTSQQNPK